MIASDFDGTWTEHPEIRGQSKIIITGASYEEFDRVMGEYEGEEKPIFFNPISDKEKTFLSTVNHKSQLINKMKISKYYEDNPETVTMLKIMCPDCQIIQVREGRTAI